MHFSPVLAFAALVASVSALTTGNHGRGVNHRAIAARVAQPAAVVDDVVPTVRKRANAKRCRPRPSSTPALAVTTSKPTTTVKEEDTKPTTTPKVEDTKPTTTHKVEPTTTKAPQAEPTTKETPATTPKPQPTTTKAAPPAPATTKASSGGNNSGLSFMSGTQTGQGTFYATGLGACGITNKDSDYIAAMSHLLFDSYPGYNGANPNHNPLCNKRVKATYQGKSVTVAITDRCEGCSLTDLDFSPSAFDQLASESLGRLSGMTWVWV